MAECGAQLGADGGGRCGVGRPAGAGLPSAAGFLVQDASEEAADVAGDGVELVFEGEVAGVQEVDLGVGQIAPVSLGSGRAEDFVVAAPDGQQGQLVVRKYSWKAG